MTHTPEQANNITWFLNAIVLLRTEAASSPLAGASLILLTSNLIKNSYPTIKLKQQIKLIVFSIQK